MIFTDLFWYENVLLKNFMVRCLKTLTLLTFSFSFSTAGIQWLQQRNSGPSGAAAERAQCWVAAWELLPGWHYAQAQRLWPQQGDGQVVQTNGRSLLLTPAHLPLPKQQFWLCLFKQKNKQKTALHSNHMGNAADAYLKMVVTSACSSLQHYSFFSFFSFMDGFPTIPIVQ